MSEKKWFYVDLSARNMHNWISHFNWAHWGYKKYQPLLLFSSNIFQKICLLQIILYIVLNGRFFKKSSLFQVLPFGACWVPYRYPNQGCPKFLTPNDITRPPFVNINAQYADSLQLEMSYNITSDLCTYKVAATQHNWYWRHEQET